MASKPLKDQNIVVIGGGLGGLCAALCFARRGAAVTVYEQAPAFEEVGAGIQVASNGLRVLRALGLEPNDAFEGEGTTLHDHLGRRVAVLGTGRSLSLFGLPFSVRADESYPSSPESLISKSRYVSPFIS